MVVLMDYTFLKLTVWVKQFYHYIILWKILQVMRGYVLQLDINVYETIQGITWIIIGDRRQYFSQSLMPLSFTVNIMEVKISFPTSTIGLLVNQLSMIMPIRVINIPENWRSQYTGYQPQ